MRRWTWHGMPRSRAAQERRSGRPSRTPSADLPLLGLDGGVVASTAILMGFGVVMIFSATAPLAIDRPFPPHFARHLFALLIGALCAFAALRIPLATWRRLALPLWVGCVVLLVATLVVGVEANGARRWLEVPGLSLRLQAAELVKWATVLAVAAALSQMGDRAARRGRGIPVALLLAGPPTLLLLGQPDLGNAVVLVGLVGLLLFAAGAPLRYLLAPAVVVTGLTGVFIAIRPYALARIRGFIDPWETARSEGFQLVQSFVAFGRGGTSGVGLGDGRQKLFYLPEAHTDFILSVVAEELGLLGVLLVLGAFAALVVAGTRIARRTRDPFGMLLAFGLTALIAVPAAVNGGVVMGLLPTTGLTLPFLSFGGNSLIVSCLAIGMLLRIGACEGRDGGVFRRSR